MREDHQEALDRMFPRGFIIVHVGNDNSMSYYMNNPKNVEQLFQIEDGLKVFSEGPQ